MIEPERGRSHPLPRRRLGAFHVLVVLLFVGSIGHFYDSRTGFTSLIGRPLWVLQAYALQNVACWLGLA